MSKSKLYQTGEKYELYIGDRNGEHVTIGIRLKEGTFDPRTNMVAVILTSDMAEEVARDILYRIDA